jgi:hypothetical protein
MKTIIEMARKYTVGGLEFDVEGLELFVNDVRADERNAIYDQWHSCVMSDLENGVKWLNEKAAAEWHKNYPAQSTLFPSWVEARGQA